MTGPGPFEQQGSGTLTVVLAGVAILARRRWLLSGGVLVAMAGVGLLASGAIV